MKYFAAHVRPTKSYHGHDADRSPIIHQLPKQEFVEKIIRLDRVLSFTEEYIFIECPHDTVQTWEYQGSLSEMKAKLESAGLFIA